jgi:acetylornithine deacetylase/succinyl-diaminopimelate desuccinylase-like protein
MEQVQAFIGQSLSRIHAELFDFLRIPSISADSAYDPDTERTASWLAERMTEAGMDTEILPTPGHPVVLGEWLGAGPDAPTVLIYGHYDVQPPDPLDLWTSPPFEPEVRDGRIYARGSADDKGQLYLHVKAVEAHLKTHGSLPVNVIVMAEGEEEVGSPNLVPFVEQHRERLACDVVVVSDSAMFAPGLPSILYSLRGLAYFEILVDGPSADLHSGSYGGAVTNPANALARIITSLQDDSGRIAIDGFYDNVADWSDEAKQSLRELPFDEGEFSELVGGRELGGGETGYSVLERIWTRPTCDVNGLWSGYQGEGAKTVLPAKAGAKVSFRLVKNQQPDRIEELLRAHVEKVAPVGVTAKVVTHHGGFPWMATVEGPWAEAAKTALESAFGAAPVFTGEGGSIPIVVEFERILEAPALLLGFSLPGANLHSPDEWFPEDHVEKGIRCLATLFQAMGG